MHNLLLPRAYEDWLLSMVSMCNHSCISTANSKRPHSLLICKTTCAVLKQHVLCCAVLCCAVLCCAVLCCAATFQATYKHMSECM